MTWLSFCQSDSPGFCSCYMFVQVLSSAWETVLHSPFSPSELLWQLLLEDKLAGLTEDLVTWPDNNERKIGDKPFLLPIKNR